MIEQQVAAIPTLYSGVRFRSRLEAKWAAMFDLLGCQWQYEPFDLHGYIPDFIVNSKLLVEIKPSIGDAWDAEAWEKINRSGWVGPSAVFGSELRLGEYESNDWTPGNTTVVNDRSGRKLLWEVVFGRCSACGRQGSSVDGNLPGRITVFPGFCSGGDGRECLLCGADYVQYLGSDRTPVAANTTWQSWGTDRVIPRLWKQAGNVVQWRP